MKLSRYSIILSLLFIANCNLPKLDRIFLETYNIIRLIQNSEKNAESNLIQNGLSEGMPSFGPAPGEFYNPIQVRLSTNLTHSIIRYTTNGVDPSCGDETSSPVGEKFLTDISVPQPTIPGMEIRAIACFSETAGDTDEEKTNFTQVATGVFLVTNGILDPPIVGTAPGTFPTATTLTLTKPAAHPTANIHYTTDGSVPNCTSPVYSAPIDITTSQSIYAISCLQDWTSSNQVGGFYEITGTVGVPGFSHETNTYNDDVSLSLTVGTAGANIRYALSSGADPDPVLVDCTGGILYTGAIPISANNTRVVAIGCRDGWVSSAVSPMRTYTLKVVNPTLSPPGNVYQNNVSVTGNTTTGFPTTSSATVHFNTTSPVACTDPTTPVSLLANLGDDSVTTVYAIACKPNYLPSAEVQATYTMTGTLPEPVFSQPGGNITTVTNLTLSSGVGTPSTGAYYLYTMDGTNPVCPSTGLTYSTPIELNSSVTVKAVTCRTTPNLWNPSTVRTEIYTFGSQAGAPTFSASPGLESGEYKNVQTVNMGSATAGATIRYTLGNGTQTAPDCTTTGIEGTSVSITDNTNNVIKAIACHVSFSPSTVSTSPIYHLRADSPTTTEAPGVYQTGLNVNFASGTTGATIHYTLNGVVPTCSDPGPPINLTSPTPLTTIKAIACKPGFESSVVYQGNYEITGQVASPTISDPVGLNNLVSITANPQPVIGSQTICFRLGIAPECSNSHLGVASPTGGFCALGSNVYTAEIQLTGTTNIQAISCSTNWTASLIQDKTINLGTLGNVVFTPDPSVESSTAINVALSSTNSTDIYYTIDGSTPSCSGIGTLYSGTPININQTGITIQAIACAQGFVPTPVASATSNLKVGKPVLTSTPGANPQTNDLTLTWNLPTATASYFYRVDGTNPDCANTGAAGTYTMGASLTLPIVGHGSSDYNLRAIGCKAGYLNSDVDTSTYSFQVATPNLKTKSGELFNLTSHTINQTDIYFSTPTNSAKVCVTSDASNPSCNPDGTCAVGMEYLTADYFNLTATTELRAVGCRSGYMPSTAQVKNFTFDSSRLRLFLTKTHVLGNTNLTNADNLCGTDLSTPTHSGSFKALRMGGGRNPTTDWPMEEGRSYYNNLGGLIGTSLSGVPGFTVPLSLPISPIETNVWTGMDMHVAGELTQSTNHCGDWTINTTDAMGKVGSANLNTSASMDTTTPLTCDTSLPIYCIETPPATAVKRMFLTAIQYDGAFTGLSTNGLAGADEACSVDSKNPGGGAIFKAVIGSSTPLRDITTDWPLTPNTTYYQLDGTTVFLVTDANGRPTAPIISENYDGGVAVGLRAFGGFLSDFTVNTGNICQNWTTTGNPNKTAWGESNYSHLFTDGNGFFQSAVTGSCAISGFVVCAEQ